MKVYILTHPAFIGDNNHLLDIENALNMKCDKVMIAEDQLDITSLTKYDQVLVAGDHGLLMAEKIKKKKPNVGVTWSGHQIFNEFNNLTQWPNRIVLPKSVITEQFTQKIPSSCKLIKTEGVAPAVIARQLLRSELSKIASGTSLITSLSCTFLGNSCPETLIAGEKSIKLDG